MPAELKQEAALELFEQLDFVGSDLVGIHRRGEHAWLFGVAALKSEELEIGRGERT